MPSISKISFGNYGADMLSANNIKLERLKTSIDRQTRAVDENSELLKELTEVNAQALAVQNKILQKLK